MKPLVRASIDKTNLSENQKIVHASGRYEDREMWKNDIYTVIVNRNQPTAIPNPEGGTVTVCWLSIRRNDRGAARDWRHFQWIKNQLVGEENEGCELYPAESRLADGANQYHLWVFEDKRMKFPFGFTDGRVVTERSFFGEVQRPFPEDRKPADLKENEKRVEDEIEKMKKEAQEEEKRIKDEMERKRMEDFMRNRPF